MGRKAKEQPVVFTSRFQKYYYAHRADIAVKRRELYACRKLGGLCIRCGEQAEGLYCAKHKGGIL